MPELDADAYWSLLAATDLAVVIHGEDGAVVQANPAFAAMLGYTLEEALQLDSSRVVHPDDLSVRNAQADDMFAGLSQGGVVHRRLLHKSGAVIRARVRKAVVHRGDEVLVLTIIEEWGPLGDLEHDVRHDALTGLLNRRGLCEAARATYPYRPTYLAMADVDDLKAVNDTRGHAAGDRLLRAVADALRGAPLPGALIARWSGDEFVVLVPAGEDGSGPADIADVITAVTTGAMEARRPCVSVGVTVFDPEMEDLDAALIRADREMYSAKRDYC
ncbi:diguanylate cyclase [Tsukamurella sp. 8F]|uniref:GGDEF domain-containing protein n=1 Tax=unclassified Tsukamurella TaxID=2633480 RepID=UPI0023B8D070|nr:MULTISPECIES: sensor domain-containing diguanylate cyclase [unclassified Tsukamurella]MDF0532447.1 diguanylate cyclase [Tsukamurella sp. 8J]MDF0588458.1 diguanylate cyclase [Tsukamurella sp. 8F]